ncbi:MAG: MbnH family di-heme enzyme [Pseudomonadota bacterium]
MGRPPIRNAILALLTSLGVAMAAASTQETPDLRALLRVPEHIPLPPIPEENPLTPEKVTLGRHLFYDRRLSGNATQSCASCHFPELAFADGKRRPTGSTGQPHPRNSMALVNLAWLPTLTWASPSLTTLESQIHIPIRSDRPVELGVNDANAPHVLARFAEDPDYRAMFAAAFPAAPEPSFNKVVFALASFVRTMTSFDTPYDRYLSGDEAALSSPARKGLALFNGERFECFHCHSGVMLTTAYVDAETDPGARPFHFFSNGLYNIGNTGDYPAHDQGLFEHTQNRRHRGLFRPPTLRNIALTGPYMHDGSLASLDAVIDHYAAGGRLIEHGPFAGDGRLHPGKSHFVRGFRATPAERAALRAFLESLTDMTFLGREDLAPPQSPDP